MLSELFSAAIDTPIAAVTLPKIVIDSVSLTTQYSLACLQVMSEDSHHSVRHLQSEIAPCCPSPNYMVKTPKLYIADVPILDVSTSTSMYA